MAGRWLSGVSALAPERCPGNVSAYFAAVMDQQWDRLKDFQVSSPSDELGFIDRLARDNGWSYRFAQGAYGEYLRFIYLMWVTEYSLTPSDEVDQVWHLHLCYSKSYWEDLCQDALGGVMLHHGPTKGGKSEAKRFDAQYDATLQLYKEHFGHKPPKKYWPPKRKRFNQHDRWRRINLRGAIVLRWPMYLMIFFAALATVFVGPNKFIDGLKAGNPSNIFVAFVLVGSFMTLLAKADRSGKGKGGCGGGCGTSSCGGDGCGGGGCGGCGGCGG